MDVDAGLVLDQGIQPAQQRTAAREHDAAVDDVAGKFRRGTFKRILDGIHDAQQAFAHRLAHFLGPDKDVFGQAVHKVAALDLHAGLGVLRAGRADLNFDLLGGALTDQQVVFALDERDDALVQRIARAAHAAAGHDAGQADDRHFRRAAADIHDHAADGIGGGQARADGGSHGFLNDRDLARARFGGGLAYGAALDLRHAGRHANDHPRVGQKAVAAGLADEALQHGGGNIKVCDDAVLQRADRHNGAWCAADDGLCLVPDAADAQFIATRVHGHHAGFAHDDAAAFHVHQRVGGAQINADILGKHSLYSPEKCSQSFFQFAHSAPTFFGGAVGFLRKFAQKLRRTVDRQPHNVIVTPFDARAP